MRYAFFCYFFQIETEHIFLYNENICSYFVYALKE